MLKLGARQWEIVRGNRSGKTVGILGIVGILTHFEAEDYVWKLDIMHKSLWILSIFSKCFNTPKLWFLFFPLTYMKEKERWMEISKKICLLMQIPEWALFSQSF